MGHLGWEAKAFVGHLLGLWYDPFEHMLDYTSGEATCTQDQPAQFDRNGIDEPQDVVEYWAMDWSRNGNCHEQPHRSGSGLGLDAAWYRDVLRAKMVSLRLPRRFSWNTKKQSRRGSPKSTDALILQRWIGPADFEFGSAGTGLTSLMRKRTAFENALRLLRLGRFC